MLNVHNFVAGDRPEVDFGRGIFTINIERFLAVAVRKAITGGKYRVATVPRYLMRGNFRSLSFQC
jgi:hypothetical protein